MPVDGRVPVGAGASTKTVMAKCGSRLYTGPALKELIEKCSVNGGKHQIFMLLKDNKVWKGLFLLLVGKDYYHVRIITSLKAGIQNYLIVVLLWS